MTAVLVIAGCDSSGGAGLARDIRTLSQLDVDALCAVTAVTAQTHQALLAASVLPAELVRAQIESAFASATIGAVKIGMLATAATVHAVAAVLRRHRQVPVVLDPVLAASSGGELLDPSGRAALVAELLPLATLLTPNLPEAAVLLGNAAARDEQEMQQQAHALLALGPRAVLLKGGHAPLEQAVDILILQDGRSERFAARRAGTSRRGSGCALASAVAAHLARGVALPAACAGAKAYINRLFDLAE
jgi:hydroxymethylpyrimidine/phosphomethylpyrimidine kinase